MDFAKKLLNKYGWKEGEGLGKNSDGIAKPLKALLKFDNAGLGSDQAASDFNNHWWERVFNEAAQNVDVKKEQDGQVSMDIKGEDEVEITTKGYSLKKLKKAKKQKISDEDCVGNGQSELKYNNFLQSATLTKEGHTIEKQHKIEMNEISVTKVKVLTDEELFKACGGRTAHKGARHGLKLSGKLSRLEQQEAALLAQVTASKKALDEKLNGTTVDKTKKQSKSLDGNDNSSSDDIKSKKSKKKKSISKEQENATEIEDQQTAELKKKKKKRKHEEANMCEDANLFIEKQSSTAETTNKKKKTKLEQIEAEETTAEKETKKSKKKKKSKQ